MTPSERLEHLISRYIDGESTYRERRELRSRMNSDPQAASLFDEISSLDREMAWAMRRALHRRGRFVPVWIRAGSGLGLAAAACLAAFAWLWSPAHKPQTPGREGDSRQAASWFAPPPAAGDSFEPQFVDPSSGRRSGETSGRWIVVPSDRRGEFLIVEIKHARPRPPRASGEY
ncbi:MAG: hypothetical protein U1D55_01975 [Phycisphaerae bacterium]